jgi:uncharacterized protein involved in exopolysaccharide biosynthesis/Mrp family chromosome partitioning ATPase
MDMEQIPDRLPQAEPEEPGLRDYWRIIVEGRWIIIGAFLVVLLSTTFFTFTAHPIYQATARILVDTNKPVSNDIASLISPLISGTHNEIQNRIEVMSSPPVLAATIQKLEADAEFVAAHRAAQGQSFWSRLWHKILGEPATAQTVGGASDPPLMTEVDLRQRVDVKQVPNTDMIEVRATGGSALEAQLTTNALLEAYKEQDLQFSQATLTSVKDFLQQQLAQMEVKLQNSEQALVDFEKQAGLELSPDDIGKQLLQLEQLLAQAKVDLEDKQRELDAIDTMLDQVTNDFLSKESGAERTDIINETQLKLDQMRKLQDDIAQLEQKRVAYLNKDNFIMAKEMEDEITAKQKAADEAAKTQLHTFDLLPKYEELIHQQLQTTLEINALKDRVDVIQQARDAEAKRITDNSLQFLQVQQNLDSDKNVYILLREEYEKTRMAEAGEIGGVRIVNLAEPPTDPIKPNKKLNLALGALIGLILGTGLTFLRSYLDNSVKTLKDLDTLGLTGLGTVLRAGGTVHANGDEETSIRRRLLTNFETKSAEFDAYISIDAAIRFSELDKPPRSLLVTSVLPGEGKTTTAVNLALAMARSGKRVLLVDTDLRRPNITQLFKLQKLPGLADLAVKKNLNPADVIQTPYTQAEWRRLKPDRLKALLVDNQLKAADWDRTVALQAGEASKLSLEDILVRQGFITKQVLDTVLDTHFKGLQNFFVLPSGELPPSAAAFLGSARVHEILQALHSEFDALILDSPPLAAAADTMILSRLVDGVLMVIEAERTTQEDIRQAIEQLRKVEAAVVGAVLNKANPSIGRYYGSYYGHGYGYGYGYGYGEEKRKGVRN